MSETRDFVREEGKEKNSIIIVLLQAHTHIHAGETRFLSPLLYIYTYICVYIYMYIYIVIIDKQVKRFFWQASLKL